jgi:hypothetical protein
MGTPHATLGIDRQAVGYAIVRAHAGKDAPVAEKRDAGCEIIGEETSPEGITEVENITPG